MNTDDPKSSESGSTPRKGDVSPLTPYSISLSTLNGTVSSKILDNYNFNFNSVQNEISDVAL